MKNKKVLFLKKKNCVNIKTKRLCLLTKFSGKVLILFFSAFPGIPVVVILASIPWLLPWDELKVPYLPSFHVVASIAPWIGSTIYHLFMNHNTVFTVVDLTAPDLTGCTKGQLISKFLFWCHRFDQQNDCKDFCPESSYSLLRASWKLFGTSRRLPYK